MESIEQQFKKEVEKIDRQIFNDLNQLSSILQEITPVDTSFLKGEWSGVEKISDFHYQINNNANYASYVLIDGHSQQLSMGILPTIRTFLEKKYGG